MAEKFEDFSIDQVRFDNALTILEKELKSSSFPSVNEMVETIDQQIGSSLLFAFSLGLKANLDHFLNPVSHTFLDVDAETYLREDIARRLPDYQYAEQLQKQFYATLSPSQQDLYRDIISYICHLETIGPKWAHYYGYTLDNQLFPCIIPGYSADM